MTKLLLTSLFLLPLVSLAQIDTASTDLPYKDGKILYEVVNEAPGSTQSALFGSAKKWVADTFKSAKDVIQSENESTGQIICKGITTVTNIKKGALLGVAMTLKFQLQIDCKDSKYRLRFYDLSKYNAAGYLPEMNTSLEEFDQLQTKRKKTERWAQLIKITNKHFASLSEDFRASIEKSKTDTF